MVRCPRGFKKSRSHGCIPKNSRSPGRRKYTKKQGKMYGRPKRKSPVKNPRVGLNLGALARKKEKNEYKLTLYSFDANGKENKFTFYVHKNEIMSDLKKALEEFEDDLDEFNIDLEDVAAEIEQKKDGTVLHIKGTYDSFIRDLKIEKHMGMF